jgi:pyruvate kinase
MNLHITCVPSDPHFVEFCSDSNVAGIRMNGLLFRASELMDQLSRIPATTTVPLWFDAKGRQLRVEEAIYHKDHLELVMNHKITGLVLPHPIIFKAGEDWAMVERIDGKRLVLRADGYPKYRVKPGDSVHFRDMRMAIDGPLFTDDEKSKIEMVVKAGAKRFYLSYVEQPRDVEEFRELIGNSAELILKIESKRGLRFVSMLPSPDLKGFRLACARGDLYVEVDQPHQIIEAQRLIIERDPNAMVGSRMLLSLFANNVPSCSDINELALLKSMGYKNFLLCDDLCKKGSALHRAVDTFTALSKT